MRGMIRPSFPYPEFGRAGGKRVDPDSWVLLVALEVKWNMFVGELSFGGVIETTSGNGLAPEEPSVPEEEGEGTRWRGRGFRGVSFGIIDLATGPGLDSALSDEEVEGRGLTGRAGAVVGLSSILIASNCPGISW